MRWLFSFIVPGSMAQALLLISLTGALGLCLGQVRVGSLKVGVIGVLVAGIFFGHLGWSLPPEIHEFVREFGLILFVYSIGMQVGPGFISSFKKQGMLLGALGVGIVVMGAALTAGLAWSRRMPALAAIGLYTGAVTNTPALGAAQQAVKDLSASQPVPEEALHQVGTGYALAYPFGILGTILAMLLVRWFFRIDLKKEADAFHASQSSGRPLLKTMNIEVTNPNLEGKALRGIPTLGDTGAVVSRLWHDQRLSVARPDTVVHLGDVLLVVGPLHDLDALRVVVGRESAVDLRAVASSIEVRRVLVTQTSAVNSTLEELDLAHRYGAAVTRVIRGEVEFSAFPERRLNYGDVLVMVGEAEALDRVARELGNQAKQLNQPPILPIFVGLVLGVLAGSYPFHVPALGVPLKLGLAGGPLVVAMLLSASGRVGPLVWYLPGGASFTLREMGIVLFLACVGLKAGDGFVATLLGGGWVWMFWAAAITLLPVFIAGVIARVFGKMNYFSICGLIAGSHTDPPALAFAGALTSSEGPATAYATVYPLVMLLRVLSGQVLVLIASRWG